MNWQQLVPLLIVLIVAVIFVWRSSGGKKSGCGCPGGCSHEHTNDTKKESVPR